MTTVHSGFLAEPRRRQLWRVAVAYLIAAWLIVQVATQVFPFFNIPDWIVRFVVVALVIGFVIAVPMAWIFEVTPNGIRRTVPTGAPETRETHTTRAVGRRLNTVITVVLALAVLLLLGNQFM